MLLRDRTEWAVMNKLVEAIKNVITREELTPSVCCDSGQAEWNEGEAIKLAEAIVQELAFLYNEYGLEDDSNLTKDAQELKTDVLQPFSGTRPEDQNTCITLDTKR